MKVSLLKLLFVTALISVVFSEDTFACNNFSQEKTYSEEENSTAGDSYNNSRRKIRLGFTAPSTMHRQLLLTEDENATSGIDWGYDGEYYATDYDDMYWLIEGQLFTIQGTDVVDETSNFPIGFHTNDSGMVTISIDALENISDDFDLYLYDVELGVHHNLRDAAYEFYAEAGEYLSRFSLVFTEAQEPAASLSVDENELKNFKIHYNSLSNTLTLNNTSNIILKGLYIYNITGQLVYNYSLNETSNRKEFQLNNSPAKGTYIVLIETEKGSVSKKVVLH